MSINDLVRKMLAPTVTAQQLTLPLEWEKTSFWKQKINMKPIVPFAILCTSLTMSGIMTYVDYRTNLSRAEQHASQHYQGGVYGWYISNGVKPGDRPSFQQIQTYLEYARAQSSTTNSTTHSTQ